MEFDIIKQLCWLFWKLNYILEETFSGFISIHFPELVSQYFEHCNIYHYTTFACTKQHKFCMQ